MSRLLLEGKSDSKGLVGAETSYLGIAEDRWGGGRDQGPGGRWGQEGQHYCLLQRGQGWEVS